MLELFFQTPELRRVERAVFWLNKLSFQEHVMHPIKTLIFFFLFQMTLLSFVGPAFCAGIYQVATNVDDGIELELRQRILSIKRDLLVGLRTGDLEKVENILSPRLLNSKGFDIESFVSQISGVAKNEFVVLNHYHSTLPLGIGFDHRVNIVPSLSDKELLRIKNLRFFGREAYNLFLESTNKGWQILLFLSLSKYGNDWKINTIHFGSYSISHLTAPKLHQLQKEAYENGRLTSCMIYSWAMEKLLRPAPYLQFPDEKKYIDLMELVQSGSNRKVLFPFTISDAEIIGMDVVTTDDEGLIPVVYYITQKEFGSGITTEVRQMKDGIVAKLPGIEKDFDKMLVRAFREAPIDPEKQYENYAVVLELR